MDPLRPGGSVGTQWHDIAIAVAGGRSGKRVVRYGGMYRAILFQSRFAGVAISEVLKGIVVQMDYIRGSDGYIGRKVEIRHINSGLPGLSASYVRSGYGF